MSIDPDDVRALAIGAARAADDKKGLDTVILDVGPVLMITDVFVITSAPNTRLVRTLADEVERVLKLEAGRAPLRVEGLRDLTWVLLDYGDLVVHIFLDETRRFYDIERLYRDVVRIAWEPAAEVADPA
ncbi:MAG TPA: ribosome silencing factor [Acidimicrobiales bacterium]